MKAYSPPSSALLSLLAVAIQAALSPQTSQAGTWNAGGGTDKSWITPNPSPYLNWDSEVNPASTAVVFDDAHKTTRTSPNNIVTQNISVASLRYMNLGETENDWHVTQINLGTTLTVVSGFTVGGYSTGNFAAGFTRAAIGGDGALSVTGGSVNIGSNGSDPAVGELDMSGLASFISTANTFNVGNGRMNTGYMSLAKTNAITATTLTVGSSAGNNAASTRVSRFELGRENTLKVQDLFIGGSNFAHTLNGNRQSGELLFQTYESGPVPSVIIRGKNSTDLAPTGANLIIGKVASEITTNAVAVNVAGTADFTGGTVDALLNNLAIGIGKNTTGTTTGTLSMDDGSIAAQTTLLGQSTTAGTANAGFATGNFNIGGGTFTTASLVLAENLAGAQKVQGNLNVSGGFVEVTGENGIVMGVKNAVDGTATEIRANIALTSGTLKVNGDIAKGTASADVTATVKLDGGTLDMNNHDLQVDSFEVKSGSIKNLGQLNLGGTLLKTGAGTVILDGSNQYTGATDISAGTLLVNGSLSETSGVIVRGGATLGGIAEINENALVQVEAGGVIAPGSSASTLSIGSLDIQTGGSLSVSLNGPDGAAGDYGTLNVSEGVTLDGADLKLTLGFAPVEGQTFVLLSNQGESAIDGLFTSVNGVALELDNLFTLQFNSIDYQFELFHNSPDYGSGYDVVIQAVPEPGALYSGALGALLLFGATRGLRRKGVLN